MDLIEGIFSDMDKRALSKIMSDKGIETDADVSLNIDEYKKLESQVSDRGAMKKATQK